MYDQALHQNQAPNSTLNFPNHQVSNYGKDVTNEVKLYTVSLLSDLEYLQILHRIFLSRNPE